MLFCAALLPILLAVILMTGFKVSPGKALPVSFLVTCVSAFCLWNVALSDLIAYSVLGILKSLDIILIICCAIFLLNILRDTGALNTIKNSFSGISEDRRIQVVIIGWIFSGFIEGVSGFGAAPALAAPLLLGLGFPAVPAVCAALICNTMTVPFGAVGTAFLTSCSAISDAVVQSGETPAQFNRELIQTFSTVSGCAGIFIPLIAVAMVVLLSGEKRKIRAIAEIAPFCIFSGIVYVIPWKIIAVTMGAELPSVLASAFAFPVLYAALKLRFLVPKNVWNFPEEERTVLSSPAQEQVEMPRWKAWMPYLFIALLLVLTRLPSLPLGKWMAQISRIRISQVFSTPGTAFQWSVLSNPGVFPFLIVGLLFALYYGMSRQGVFDVLKKSEKQVRYPALAIAAGFAMVQVMISSAGNPAELPGMLNVIAEAVVRSTGKYYVLVSPVIGCFGTFFAGSCTVSNILFCPIQYNAAELLNVPETMMIALQNCGGGIGSMLRLSGIVATCATVNAVGKEGKIILLNSIPALIMILLTLLSMYLCGIVLG